ncbi:hypothetical protein ACFYSF_33745 [Streptomyces canus]|uniref:hypothetical protein n=1 Tax=Streptomyces canus TaxID=58343 RepID=UPI00368BAB71
MTSAAFGKTTVVAQVARTLCESGAFPDGLLWVALGPVARPRPALKAWGRVLGVDLLGEHTASACRDRLRAALSGTRTLPVIDDVGRPKTHSMLRWFPIQAPSWSSRSSWS